MEKPTGRTRRIRKTEPKGTRFRRVKSDSLFPPALEKHRVKNQSFFSSTRENLAEPVETGARESTWAILKDENEKKRLRVERARERMRGAGLKKENEKETTRRRALSLYQMIQLSIITNRLDVLFLS